jgi:hypothetical protein
VSSDGLLEHSNEPLGSTKVGISALAEPTSSFLRTTLL